MKLPKKLPKYVLYLSNEITQICLMRNINPFFYILLGLCLQVLSVPAIMAQDEMDVIKRDPSYIWGQGVAETLQAADDNAVKDLISQISVNVDSRTETTVSNEVGNDDVHSSVSTTGNLRVSSSVSLSNCRRIVSEEGSYFIVLRYVDKSEVAKMFDARKTKIKDLIHAGERAEEISKVGDALRNYYWALKLVLSIPEEHRSYMTTESGALLTTSLRERINQVLDSVHITVLKEEKNADEHIVRLQFMYHGQPVNNCDYTYFDGYDWPTASVKDGVGLVDLPADTKNMLLRVEYEFRKLWKSDPMVNTLLEQMPSRLPFSTAEKRVDLTRTEPVEPEPLQTMKEMTKEIASEMVVDSLAECKKKEVARQADIVAPVIQAIEERQYDNIRPLCSENGWKWFEKLVKYGNAKIIERDSLSISSFEDGYLIRGIKARFSFKKNNKSFVEDLVFYTKDGLIDGINFGLEQGAIDDINGHSMWDAQSRLVLVNFLENYKTAYALERLDYLNAVFSEDALIIVGNRIPQQKSAEISAVDMESYEHNKLTKNQYMRQLEKVFAKQEYVNIQFEDASVKKTSRTSERYEIVIKQNYYSATYADKGYLYLLADISNPASPIIHVRVWDENRNNLMNYGEWIF